MEPRTTEDFFGLVGYQLDGKYNIEAVVARGGFGVVYRARHAVLHTQLAVKVLRVPDDTSSAARERFLEQFVEEARIVALLQHPSIVRVTDFGVSTMHDNSQAPWMVLEWIEGQTLAASLNARKGAGGRSPRECLDILRPVIDALATAHDAGIAHRDIKPGNIMLPAERTAARSRGVTRAAAPAAARVLDFGIAKIMGDGDDGPVTGLTQTHSVAPSFSPRYASPEQASGTRTGPWTDVHALGLILTEMLTDIAVFPSADKMELHVKVMSPTRPTPAQFGVDVGAWEPVLARALALRPADRYPNAGELLAALEAEVPEPGRPTTPDPPVAAPDAGNTARHRAVAVDTGPTLSPTERVARSPRRDAHRAIGAAALILSVGLIALGAAIGARHRADGVLAPRAVVAIARPPVAPAPLVDASVAFVAPVAPAVVAQVVVAPAPPTPAAPLRAPRPRAPQRVRPARLDAGSARLRPE